MSSLEQDDEDIFDQVERAVEAAMSQVEQVIWGDAALVWGTACGCEGESRVQ